MVRSRIQIKKIENISARQVTFAKRRKGLIKKAQELSTLCDAQIGLIVFSSSGRLYEYSTSSKRVTQVIQKYMRHTENSEVDSSIVQPYLDEDCVVLRKEVDEKNLELSQLEGDNLERLELDELTKLERQIEKSYARVRRTKDDMLQKVLTDLKKKENTILQNNRKLNQKIVQATNGEVHSRQQVAVTEAINHSHLQNIVSLDTSLKLGRV
ncbi:MADS-box protein JOINTLESS-like [Amaranthus tricolor]|uniref:MADS-box protein JOINTLESS-like n=1 Tax=Amaranthus tricolor TaxID=29722 RepID=UPI0025879D62|nr:MADS-box protein JOINTLESS-like [Amaranthus tricolor]